MTRSRSAPVTRTHDPRVESAHQAVLEIVSATSGHHWRPQHLHEAVGYMVRVYVDMSGITAVPLERGLVRAFRSGMLECIRRNGQPTEMRLVGLRDSEAAAVKAAVGRALDDVGLVASGTPVDWVLQYRSTQELLQP